MITNNKWLNGISWFRILGPNDRRLVSMGQLAGSNRV